MGSKNSLAFIIPAYNEEVLLPATLKTLFSITQKLSEYDCRIIVVDNNSSDQTSTVAAKAGAKVVFEPVNQISKARNKGAKSAPDADYLFFIDADTQPTYEVVTDALKVLKSGNFCGGGCLVKFDTPSLFVDFWLILSKLTKIAAGAFIFCTNEAYKNCGGYSEEIYAAEDVVFSRALSKWGKKNGKGGFTILTKSFIITSDRKMKWYSKWEIFTKMFSLGFMPWRLKKRKNADFWYKRPDSSSSKPE
ncbi:MAG: glycosyltransferase [Lentisphaerales bacterium]|nr:glycosyltransferase [Lentisphaerales bacterium]